MESTLILAALELARRTEFVYVSTLQDEGYPDTRVMFNLLELRAEVLVDGPAALAYPFSTWLATNSSSQKVRHLRKDPRVCLYHADPVTFEGLGLQGTVEEVQESDSKRALWMPAWEMYYPGGLEGGDFTLLRFKPERGRYYHGLSVLEFDASMPHAGIQS
jgi:general stress protein 26